MPLIFKMSLFIESKLTSIKKFYFLEYFLIFLRSVDRHKAESEIFNLFIVQKDEYKLGESRYKKLGANQEDKRLNRYKYTFNQVLEECLIYGLVTKSESEITLTKSGLDLLHKYKVENTDVFYISIFELMEEQLNGFYQLIKNCYSANINGLLVFPIYSPPKLSLSKENIKTGNDVIHYIEILTRKLEKDLLKYLNKSTNLDNPKGLIISKLIEAELITESKELFNPKYYNIILKRIRDFWLNYFLKDIYDISLSLSYFDIWCYRGKQLGIINITEYFPDFDGKIVYPISIVSKSINNGDFKNLKEYKTGECLYIHEPSLENITEKFSKELYETYIDIKYKSKSTFISIPTLRDLVCYKMKISYKLFQDLLEHIYILNLKDKIKLKISLEADRLPDETKIIYQIREPVVIEGQLRNIIAIDIKK